MEIGKKGRIEGKGGERRGREREGEKEKGERRKEGEKEEKFAGRRLRDDGGTETDGRRALIE